MRRMARHRDDRGASAVEYALIITLVGGVVLAVSLLGRSVAGNFDAMATCFSGTCAPTAATESTARIGVTPPATGSSDDSTPRGTGHGGDQGDDDQGGNGRNGNG